jgi:hypothetical protein
MFRSLLRAQFLNPVQLGKMLMYLPQFVRLFYRLMHDVRVPIWAKMVPVLGILALLSPPALELDLIPIVGELDWMLVIYLTHKVFIWLCPPDVVREHVLQIARGQ